MNRAVKSFLFVFFLACLVPFSNADEDLSGSPEEALTIPDAGSQLNGEATSFGDLPPQLRLFNDKYILIGFSNEYENKSKDILLAMIKDDTLSDFQMAAAVRVFKDLYSTEVFARDKRIIEKNLLQRLNRTDSPFVQVEIMHTLCRMDRYKYFNPMIPSLISKLDHYNSTVNELTYAALNDIIESGHNRAREARVVFNTLRKVMFLSRRRLTEVTEPDPRLKQKLALIRWSTKVLGSQELKRLPKEVLNLL